MKHCIPILLTIMIAIMGSCNNKAIQKGKEPSIMILRLSIDHTLSEERWEKVYSSIAAYPDCCDEIWFSTGLGYPQMEIHRKNAEVIKKASEQLKKIGIKSSIQLQMTVGHGDQFNADYSTTYKAKDWGGWTGSTGVVDSCCSCPRQTKFIEYIRQMAAIYAENKPVLCWVDDDLRDDNHQPATNNSFEGCWCDKCIGDFNSENGTDWTRESLASAIGKDPELHEKWKAFSIGSLSNLTSVITTEVHKISPETKMGLQCNAEKCYVNRTTAIVKTMNEYSKHPVGIRPGGGVYYESDQRQQIIKSINSVEFRKLMKDPDYVDFWCPEVETYPRTYESRSAQSVMVEGFTALAYGFNSISFFVTSSFLEDQNLHRDYLYKPLSDGSKVIKSYAKDNEGTNVVGYEADVDVTGKYCLGVTGIPVLVGTGKSLGKLTKDDMSIYAPTASSKDVQRLRDNLNERMPAPAVCCSPFFGHIIQRVDSTGNLKTIALINTRIDYQYNIRIRLNSSPSNLKPVSIKWHELKKDPLILPIEKEANQLYVTIPSIFPWSVGYLSIN